MQTTKLLIPLIVVMLLCSPGVATAQSFEDGATAYQASQLQKAIQIWGRMARAGHVVSQYNMGVINEQGIGKAARPDIAAFWYRLAAFNGFRMAQYNLGALYAAGTGVPKVAEDALFWWRQAANNGDARAQFSLAIILLKQDGVPNAEKLGRARLQQAVDGGHPRARQLAVLLQQNGTAPENLAFSQPYQRPILSITSPQGSAASASAVSKPATQTYQSYVWLLDQPDDNYTIRISSFDSKPAAVEFIQKWRLPVPGAVYFDGRYYGIASGSFEDKNLAYNRLENIENLDASLDNKQVKLKRIKSLKRTVSPE